MLSIADLLSIELNARLMRSTSAMSNAVMLALGDASATFAPSSPFSLSEIQPTAIYFGLSILTAPLPLLVGALMTERNTEMRQLSLFTWIEDNAIMEPRAEIFGLTPFGEQPILFLRDLDLDRPPHAYVLPSREWQRVAGVLLVNEAAPEQTHELNGDAAELALIAAGLPRDAADFVNGIRAEVARGVSVKAALRARRRSTDAKLMSLCDGMRVLARATRVVELGAGRELNALTIA
jgi:hypothetical protein